MKTIFTLGLTLFFSISSSAQKLDLDRFSFTFEYRNLPHTPLATDFKNYSVLADVSGNIANSMSAEVLSSRIVLQGYERSEANGDLRINIRTDDLMIEKYQIVETSTETKNKDGSVTKNYSYYISIDYSIGGSVSFNSKAGLELAPPVGLFGSRNYNWASSSYTSRSEASNYYYNNKLAIINKLVRERMEEGISTINYHLNYNFGYPVTNVNWSVWLLDSKKHPETAPMIQRWEVLKPAIQGITANQITDDTKSKLQVMIAYFDEIKTKYNSEEKPDKKMRYAAFYNNTIFYLILDMPDKAATEAQGLITNDYDAKDGERLAKDAEALMSLFNLNHIQSRHFAK